MSKEAEYHSKDFEWEELKQQVENDESLHHHLLQSVDPHSSSSPQEDSISRSWNRFHVRHSTGKFFKERRYLMKEFPELQTCDDDVYAKVLEVGCGNGSTVLPILRGNKNITVYACDCSEEALDRTAGMINEAGIDMVKSRFHLFCCDFSETEFPKWLACDSCRKDLPYFHEESKGKEGIHRAEPFSVNEVNFCIGGVDYITMIFTLSAIPLHKMPSSIEECFTVLKPGGQLFFRDYGLYDMTMLRFEHDQRVGFREYMRTDGTRSYFFSLDTVRDLFAGAGFIVVELEYCCIKSVNRRNGKSMRRVWVHGKFQKPTYSSGGCSTHQNSHYQGEKDIEKLETEF